MTSDDYNKTVDLFADNVYRFIVKMVKNEMIAEDIVQDTYERLWKHHNEVTFEKSKAYLFSTSYHLMIDMIRREKKQDNWDQVRESEYIQDEEYDNINEILHRAIEQLPENQRSVLLLRDYEGYSYKEIEELTGLNEAQVKVYIYRGRLFLKNHLERLKITV